MKRFYINATFQIGQTINVPDEVMRHMHVLRLRSGEEVEIFNGNNQTFYSEITSLEKRSIQLKIIAEKALAVPHSTKITLAIALIANDKMDLVIQKAIELGANNIIPLISERSQRLESSRLANRMHHWQNIIISSCAQCGQNLLPTITPPITLDKLFGSRNYDLKIIMTPSVTNASSLQELPMNTSLSVTEADVVSPKEVILLVGPEGGVTVQEVDMAINDGYTTLQLGSLVMRAETAAIAGLSLLNVYINKWNFCK